MDEVIRASIVKVQQMVKKNTPWRPDQPWKQSFHTYTDNTWKETVDSGSGSRFTTLALYSWNIDFMLPYPQSRMRKALQCLQSLCSASSDTIATIIFLQECTADDLELLAAHEWIRHSFHLSDLDTSCWASGFYGTVTLADRRLSILNSFRVHYAKTKMERDAFFTDVRLGHNSVVRVCNSHLESLALEPPMRPHQMMLAAKYMHDQEIAGAVAAGDFNAIQAFDRNLHSDNELRDAYLELGGKEDHEDGYTWGQQASTDLKNQFGLSRMDKIFYCGTLQLESFERFGADVQVDNADERGSIVALGFEKPWITDHLGVKAVLEIAKIKS